MSRNQYLAYLRASASVCALAWLSVSGSACGVIEYPHDKQLVDPSNDFGPSTSAGNGGAGQPKIGQQRGPSGRGATPPPPVVRGGRGETSAPARGGSAAPAAGSGVAPSA